MKKGDYGYYTSFLDGMKQESFLIQLVKITSKDYTFKVNSSDDFHLTVSKNSFPTSEWYSGENDTLKRNTIIEMFKPES